MAEGPLGVYVYGVVGAARRPPLEGITGVDPAFGLELVAHRGLAALTSRVGLDAFGTEALERNLEDLAWVERTARAHDAVVAHALAASDAVAPLPLCTIFRDRARVAELLEREHDPLLTTLRRLRGHAEWSVKVVADPARLDDAARALAAPVASGVGAATPGRAFFARRKEDAAAREQARAIAETAAAEAHDRLRREATAAVLLAPQRPQLSGRRGPMVLNGAYLVHRDRAQRFASVVGELAERHREQGLDVELSGPWAPYNFASPRERR